jgi:hypothetical protein
MSDQITFEPILPVVPMVLADAKFLSTLAEVEAQVSQLKITDALSAQHAANLQVRLTAAGKKLDEARLAIKRPFLDISKLIDDVAKAPNERIEEAKKKLRHAQIQWDIDQRRRADEAEAARKAELERLEKIKAQEDAEAKRKTEELAKLAAENAAKSTVPVMDVDFGDEPPPTPPPQKTETEKKIEAVKFAPAPVIQKPTGIAFRVSLRHRVDNINELPDAFVVKTVNDTLIRSTFCNGYKENEPLPVCPGITFYVERTTYSTGKDAF